jgi:hypothetical protein
VLTEGDLMEPSPRALCLLVAVVLCVLAAFSVTVGTVGLFPLGVAFFAAAGLV